jgi:hypothetical protein
VDGFFQVDSDTELISAFYNTVAPTVNVLLPSGGYGGNDNLFVNFTYFDAGGVNISSIPLVDSYGNTEYNIYTNGLNYEIGGNGGSAVPGFESAGNTAVFELLSGPPIPAPSSCSFKPKAMSYTEYLRSKKATEPKILSTRPKMDASDYTQRQRLASSTIFAKDGQRVGVVNTSMELTQDRLKAVNSYKKVSGGRVGDASAFTAFRGGQAIGGLVQSGMPPDRLLQVPEVIIESLPVSQRASDITRNVQGCKVSLGEQHDAASLTAPVFVDNTIRNIGTAVCRSVPAIHVAEKDDTYTPKHPDRPSQAGGQYALINQREPGKELGALGGNPHYKAGAALKNIPYVEKHHGNDLGVNPKRPFVKYQIPGGVIPAHLKANMPISTLHCPAGYPAPKTPPESPFIDIATIATLASGEWTLNSDAFIPVGKILNINDGATDFVVPVGLTLVNNGTINSTAGGGYPYFRLAGQLVNNGTFTSGYRQFDFTGGYPAEIINNGTFNILAYYMVLGSTHKITNLPTGQFTIGPGTLVMNGTSYFNNSGLFVINSTGNLETSTNSGTLYNSGPAGVITCNSTNISGTFTINNANGGVCGTGVLNGTHSLTPTGTTCPPP